MRWLMMYLADNDDVELLCQLLDADPEVALICSAGPGRWKAQRHVPTLRDGDYMLWHTPSGPMILESTVPKGPVKIVKNPLRGWTEIVKPSVKGVPWVNASPVGNFWLSIRRRSRDNRRYIGRSDLHWIGNYYGGVGYRAPRSTQRWWDSLRRRIAKVAKQIPASGPLNRRGEVWAFPAALARIRKGAKRAANPP
jgi:hypothetical protein